MRERTMDEMIKYFNDTVSAMDILRKDKMTILGMITAIGYKHQDECKTYQEIIETDRAEIEWLKKCLNDLPKADVVSRGAYDQTDWERCVALTQLKEIGKSLGERMDDVRPVVFCKDCRHRDPEDHKCDCGQLERAGCIFPVDDDYWCAHGER